MAEATKNLPRDVFMYFLSIITLVVSAVNLGMLLFQYINIYFPDVLSDYYGGKSMYLNSVRQALAFLIIVFPVYIWSARFLRKDIEANPEKKDLKVRRWLLYLTIFAAGLVIIGDLVALLNTFLDGEITARFVLKVLTILFIAGSVFYYYYAELRTEIGKRSWKWAGIRAFPWIIIAVVIVAIVFGFFVVGSPTSRRAERFDERRVNDLSILQNEIISYWQNKQVLPSSLDVLKSDTRGTIVPIDPKTGKSYEYRIISPLTFEVCAEFETDSQTDYSNPDFIKPMSIDGSGRYPTWNHGIGRTCFERTIDPDFFKPIIRQ